MQAGQGDPSAKSAPNLGASQWHAIDVPGDVNAVMVANGRMPDPRYGDQARQCHWVTSRDWWYRLRFDAPTVANCRRIDLVLDGEDGQAEVYLNGERLGRMENAFHPNRFDVTGKLRAGRPTGMR